MVITRGLAVKPETVFLISYCFPWWEEKDACPVGMLREVGHE
jgi:hypothetical protein